MKDLKDSYTVPLADYAVANALQDKPVFAWWVPYTLTKRIAIIKSTAELFHEWNELITISAWNTRFDNIIPLQRWGDSNDDDHDHDLWSEIDDDPIQGTIERIATQLIHRIQKVRNWIERRKRTTKGWEFYIRRKGGSGDWLRSQRNTWNGKDGIKDETKTKRKTE